MTKTKRKPKLPRRSHSKFMYGYVDVEQPRVNYLWDEWKPAKVNWSASGGYSVEDTEEFIRTLRRAVKRARTLNRRVFGKTY